MVEPVNERVSVMMLYKADQGQVLPYALKWQNKVHRITRLGYHQKVRLSKGVHHIFFVSTDTLSFKLRLDTDSLSWTLEEISDGLPS